MKRYWYIMKHRPNIKIVSDKIQGGYIKLLICNDGKAQIKVEINHVLRGTVYSPKKLVLSRKSKDLFNTFVEMTTSSLEDLYGGKLCAALDRQHPRDLYDIKILLENEGITDKIRKAFIVYLCSHNRPMHELLSPNPLDISDEFKNNFFKMTEHPVTISELEETRFTLFQLVKKMFTDKERSFLISFKSKNPEWDLIDLNDIYKLPAINWKLLNLKKMDNRKHHEQLNRLKMTLENNGLNVY